MSEPLRSYEQRKDTESALSVSTPPSLPIASFRRRRRGLLRRMFADPRVLEKQESEDLVAQLASALRSTRKCPNLRVLLWHGAVRES